MTVNRKLPSFKVRAETGLSTDNLNKLIVEDLFPGTSCAEGLTWSAAAVEEWQHKMRTDVDHADAVVMVLGFSLPDWITYTDCSAGAESGLREE